MLATDQLTFDQELTIDFFEIVDIDLGQAGPLADFLDPIAQGAFDLCPILIGALTDKRVLCQIAREANTAANDDI